MNCLLFTWERLFTENYIIDVYENFEQYFTPFPSFSIDDFELEDVVLCYIWQALIQAVLLMSVFEQRFRF